MWRRGARTYFWEQRKKRLWREPWAIKCGSSQGKAAVPIYPEIAEHKLRGDRKIENEK